MWTSLIPLSSHSLTLVCLFPPLVCPFRVQSPCVACDVGVSLCLEGGDGSGDTFRFLSVFKWEYRKVWLALRALP